MNNEFNGSFFRESFRGYRKEDVNEYITNTNLRHANREKEYKDRINELTARLEKNDEALSGENKQLLDEIEVLKAENELLLRKNGELHLRLEKAEENCAPAKSASEKTETEDIGSRVGNLFVMAQLNADKIISDAKAEAEAIRKDADEYSARTVREAKAKAEVVIETLNERVKEMTDSYIGEFGTIVNDIKDNFYKITENARGRADGVRKDIISMKTDVDKLIEVDKERIIKDISGN